MRVVQVSFHADRERRDPETLLAAWPTLSAVASGARRAGVDVIVVQAAHKRQTLERDGVTYHFVDDDGAEPRRLPLGVRIPRRPRRLLRQVMSMQPDVVHVHGLTYPIAVGQLSRCLDGVPILVQDHGTSPPQGWRAVVWRWSYRGISAIAFTGAEQARPFIDANVLRPEVPVFDVVEGSTAFSPGDQGESRCVTGMFGDPCFLWTGRLDANKDPLTTLTAFEHAAQELRGRDPRLWCCFGTAPLLDVVRHRISESATLRERVTLLGRRPHAEMEARFRAADFFVQTSHREGSGYSLIESLACGTPPLVTDIPSARRIVGGAGSLTPVGDADALAEAMVDWANRESSELRRAARERFEGSLTYDVIGRELRRTYEALAMRK